MRFFKGTLTRRPGLWVVHVTQEQHISPSALFFLYQAAFLSSDARSQAGAR